MAYKDIKFKNPPVKSIKSSSINRYDISLNDLEPDFDKELLRKINNDFKLKTTRSFCQEAYIKAIRNKLISKNTGYIRNFYQYQLEKQNDKSDWIINIIDCLKYTKPDPDGINDFGSVALDPADFFFKDAIEIAEEIALELSKKPQETVPPITLNLSVPELRLFNQLIIGVKLIDEKKLPDFNKILSNHFKSRASTDLISYTQLNEKKNEFFPGDIVEVRKLLEQMMKKLDKVEEDKNKKINRK
jgi:hypothetical protein